MFVLVYGLIFLLAAVIAAVFFIGGKRAPKPTSDGKNPEQAADAPAGISVGATNQKPARTSTGHN